MMTYKEFKEYEFKQNHLYNIVRISNGKTILRGASIESVYKTVDLLEKEDVKIFIY